MLFQDRINIAFTEENARRRAQGLTRLTKTDLWKAAGVTSAAATHWFKGGNGADMDTCLKIAPLMNVGALWLFDETGPKTPLSKEEHQDHAPILMVDAKASAGRGSVVFSDDTSKTLMFRRDWLAKKGAKPDSVLAFTVDGDSMLDAYIPEGSVVLANKCPEEPISGRIYVVWIGDQLFVKKLHKENDVWVARSCNKKKDYPDIPINTDSGVVGQVFWCGFEL